MKLLDQLNPIFAEWCNNFYAPNISLLKLSFSTEIYIEKMCPLIFFFLLSCISLAFLFLKFLLAFVVFLFFAFVEGISNICWRKTLIRMWCWWVL